MLMAIFWAPRAIWMGWDVVARWGWREWRLIGVSGFVHWVYSVCLPMGTLIASYTVVDAYAVKAMALSPILFDYWCNILRLPFAVIPVLRAPQQAWTLWTRQWRHALVVAVFSPATYVCVLFAVQMAPVSHVAPAREVSMLFAALIGGQLLGEGERLPRLLGAVAIAAGVTALAWS